MNGIQCSLKSEINHDNAAEKYTTQFIPCPLFDGKQICYWCCLHISEIAQPTSRVRMSEQHPEYFNKIKALSGRVAWDDINDLCSQCSK